MRKQKGYFAVERRVVSGRTVFVVKGLNDELRATYSSRGPADLDCARLNAAYALGEAHNAKANLTEEETGRK